MRKLRNYRVKRPLAAALAVLSLVLWQAPPAAAFQRRQIEAARRQKPTQTPDAEQRQLIAAQQQRAAQQPDVLELTVQEMGQLRGRGPYRNAAFNGVLPWQKSIRDVNLCNGNLFKSFTDIQVSPARGAGLAWQRTYNSNDERVGPFGVGWTHAYDIRLEEAGNNEVPRTDFFGGKHVYQRDADGLYSPPAYLFDELSSDYNDFLDNGPAQVLSDDQKGMDGTVKHFISGSTAPDTSPGSVRVIGSITDRHGNQTEFTYGSTATFGDGSTLKLLTEVTDPSGRSLEVTWTNLGSMGSPAWRITRVAGPFVDTTPVYTVTYEYNNDLNLWKVHQDPSGLNRTTTYTYTTEEGESGLLASIADPLGHTVSYQYGLTAHVGNTLWVTQVTEPGSGGNLVWTIDGNYLDGYASSSLSGQIYVLNDSSLRCVTLSLGQRTGVISYTYDSANNLTAREEGCPAVWFAEDDTTYSYVNKSEYWTYGPHGNEMTHGHTQFPEETEYSYYNASKYFQKESVTDPNGNVTTFDYFDNADMSVGNRGEVKWVRDARYSTTGEQFEYTYNSYGQKLTETNLNNVVTEYDYADTWGNLTEVVQDPGGMGHLNRTTSMEYDVAGRVLESTDPKSQTSTFTYNAVGQPLQATLPDETVTYVYGANGRTEEVTDDRGTTEITYETGNDRVASVEDPVTGTVSYTYTVGGQRATMSLPGGGTWEYGYGTTLWVGASDNLSSITGVLQRVTDDHGRIVDYGYDCYGGLRVARSNQTYNGGNLTSYQLTEYTEDKSANPSTERSHGWLKRIRNTWHYFDPCTYWNSAVLVQNDYTYDDAGNRLTNTISDHTGPIRTEEYGYDALSRLTSVDYDDGQTQTYAFDAMGNRTQKADSVSGTENYTYNSANMLLTRGANNYTNDLNGNTLTGGGRTNTWDGEDRLIQCVTGSGTNSNVYGNDGLRRQATVNGTATDFILDGSGVVRDRQGSSNVATYLHGARGPEYRRNDSTGAVRWYLYDAMGSVLGEVNESGSITATRKYDVYGGVRGSTGTSTSAHNFVGNLGHSSDLGTDLIYMRARHYDPLTGRFISEDPAWDGQNWFSYAGSSPTNNVDPTGLATSPSWWDRAWVGIRVAVQIWLAPFGLAVDDIRKKVEKGQSATEILSPLPKRGDQTDPDPDEGEMLTIGLYTLGVACIVFGLIGYALTGASVVKTRDEIAWAV